MQKQDSGRKRVLLAIPLAAILLLLVILGAEAHSRYLRSEPGQGAVVATEPERVEIWFTQDLFRREGENWILVFDPRGEEVQSGEAQIDDDDRRRLWIGLQTPLTPGEYRVEWRNLSAEDGDNDEGQFTFVLDPLADVTSTPMPDKADTLLPTSKPILVTEPAPTPQSSMTPESNTGEGCALGLVPAISLVAFGIGFTRKRG